MRKRQARQQPGFSVPPRHTIDSDADLTPAIRRHTPVDRLHKFALAWQELHFGAGKYSLGDRKRFQEANKARDT
ncbi:MAG: hypothetical protein ABWZ64_03665 [Xanthobacteraceae bacterium]